MTPIKKTFYLALGVASISTLLCSGVVYYLYALKIIPLADNYQRTRSLLAALDEKSNVFQRVVAKDLEKNNEEVKEFTKYLYAGDALSFIKFIEAKAKSHNLTQHIAAPPAGSSPATVDFSVSGKFEDILIFTREIENDAFLLRIETFSLSGLGDSMSASIKAALQTYEPQES